MPPDPIALGSNASGTSPRDLAALARNLREGASQLAAALETAPPISNGPIVPEAVTAGMIPGSESAQSGDLLEAPGESPTQPPLDGLWNGAMPNGAYALRLRLDRAVSAKVSGDLARAGPHGFEWAWSFATNPSERVLQGAAGWEVRFETPSGVTGTARLSLAWVSPEEVMASLLLSNPPSGLPSGTSLYVTLRRQGPEMRTAYLRAAIDETDIGAVETAQAVAMHLSKAGIRTTLQAFSPVPPVTPEGRGWGQAEILDAALEADLPLSIDIAHQPSTRADLVLVRNAARPDLTSFSLEPEPALQRRALFVFGQTTEGAEPAAVEALHLLGASWGLLPHRDPRVPSPPSTSPMGSAPGTLSAVLGDFTPNELAHIRHADLATFTRGLIGTEPYWLARHHQPPAPTFAAPPRTLLLEAALPPAGPVIGLGQPLFLSVKLTNTGKQSLDVDRSLLDMKAGALSVVVTREGWSPVQVTPHRFRPVLRRRVVKKVVTLPPGGGVEENLQISYGCDGTVLLEPGTYRIDVRLDLPSEGGMAARIEAPPLRLRVQEPLGRDGDREALDLLSAQSGLYVALGGSRLLRDTADHLEGIATERHKRLTRNASQRDIRSSGWGAVAAAWRARAIDLGRAYPGMPADTRERRLTKAVEIMRRFDRDLLCWFDPRTSADFLDLRTKQEQRLAKLGGPLASGSATPPTRKANPAKKN